MFVVTVNTLFSVSVFSANLPNIRGEDNRTAAQRILIRLAPECSEGRDGSSPRWS
jgi:hypothetical protein